MSSQANTALDAEILRGVTLRTDSTQSVFYASGGRTVLALASVCIACKQLSGSC